MRHGNKGRKFPAEVLTVREVRDFFATFKEWKDHSLRDKCIFALALRAQMRAFEITALRVGDIDLDKRRITIIAGKGGKRRVAGVDAETCELLQRWMAKRPRFNIRNSSLVFLTTNGQMMQTSYLRHLAQRHAREAGIQKRVHVHAFRHTGACYLADQGVDIRAISKQLGHSSLAVTDRYLDHLSGDRSASVASEVVWEGCSAIPSKVSDG
jgi:integrase/recombinase XerD